MQRLTCHIFSGRFNKQKKFIKYFLTFTLKASSKICSRRLFFYFRENVLKFQADNSYEMTGYFLYIHTYFKMSTAAVVIDALKVKKKYVSFIQNLGHSPNPQREVGPVNGL